MIREARRLRMEEVVTHRLGHLRCAAEALHHRHNVSAVLRTCEALGVHHAHLIGDEFVATRGASRGAERWMAVDRHDTAEEAIAAIKGAGYRLWVADLSDPPTAPEDVPIDEPLCIWVGAEMSGVSEVARAAADGVVTVPMRGFTQSLNVSVAAALTLRPIAERVRALGPRALLPEATQRELLASWLEREEEHDRGVEARAALRLGEP